MGILHGNPLVEDEEWHSLVKDPLIKISYVKREFLKCSDSLAKKGKDRAGVYSSWC